MECAVERAVKKRRDYGRVHCGLFRGYVHIGSGTWLDLDPELVAFMRSTRLVGVQRDREVSRMDVRGCVGVDIGGERQDLVFDAAHLH
jgi:hypothetical protein